MRKLTESELQQIAQLYALPLPDRELQQSQQKAIVPLGPSVPLINQVLHS